MSQHIPADILSAFVVGEIDDPAAVTVAEHIDGCPSCAARAANLEPLASAFASSRDPEPPPDLIPSILARLEQPEWLFGWEVLVGTGLLLIAGLLALALDSPLALATDALVVVNASGTLVRGMASALGSFQLSLSFAAAAALTGAVLTLHFGSGSPGSELPSRRAP
jgi:anti-sigma factor RsiW